MHDQKAIFLQPGSASRPSMASASEKGGRLQDSLSWLHWESIDLYHGGYKVKVLVTGGAGFIGSHIARILAAEHQVMILDDMSGGNVDNVPENARLEIGSILNHHLV